LFRWCFALKEGWRNRQELKSFLHDPSKRVGSLVEITPERLEQSNIGVLVLDFDGVLAPHGAVEPLPEACTWLRDLCNHIGEQRIALLTNKPFSSRLAYFAKEFPSIYIAQVRRKKPYPDGLLQIAEYKGIERHRLALLDDRLLTGMLATCLAYTQGFYFYKPYRNLLRRPIVETFFSFLRIVERLFVTCV
jgi:predicted HAD superfamily phosphohydrolase YqeG